MKQFVLYHTQLMAAIERAPGEGALIDNAFLNGSLQISSRTFNVQCLDGPMRRRLLGL